MSRRRWADRSTVTIAEDPTPFEFVTDSVAGTVRPMVARWRSRYDIERTDSGCRISYSMVLLEASHPPLPMALPGISELTWPIGIPMLVGRGLKNLAALALERAALAPAAAGEG
jgi:hypothetical protein